MASIYLNVFLSLALPSISWALSLSNAARLPDGYDNIYFGTLVYDGLDSIFYIGAADNGDCHILKYNVAQSKEKPKWVSDCPPGVAGGEGAGTDGKGNIFYFEVGYSPDDVYHKYLANSHETGIYQLSSKSPTLKKIGTIPRAITMHTTGSDGSGSLYIYGGFQEKPSGGDGFFKYNCTSNNVTQLGTLQSPDQFAVKGTWVKGSVYVFGTPGSQANENKIFKYTPTASANQQATFLPQPILNTYLEWAPTFTIGDDIYITMLGNSDEVDLYIYNTVKGSVRPVKLPNVPESYNYPRAVYVEKQKRIYFFGGNTGTFSGITYIQL